MLDPYNLFIYWEIFDLSTHVRFIHNDMKRHHADTFHCLICKSIFCNKKKDNLFCKNRISSDVYCCRKEKNLIRIIRYFKLYSRLHTRPNVMVSHTAPIYLLYSTYDMLTICFNNSKTMLRIKF